MAFKKQDAHGKVVVQIVELAGCATGENKTLHPATQHISICRRQLHGIKLLMCSTITKIQLETLLNILQYRSNLHATPAQCDAAMIRIARECEV